MTVCDFQAPGGQCVTSCRAQKRGGQGARQLRSVQQPLHDGSSDVSVPPALRGLLPLPRFRRQPVAAVDVSVAKTTPEATVGRHRGRAIHAVAGNTASL